MSLTSNETTIAEQYQRDGYLVAPSVLNPEDLAALRQESDRLMELCASDPERYRERIEWESDHLQDDAHKARMNRVIRKLEPVIDISPPFRDLATAPGVADPIAAIFGEPIELFEDKLNLKLPGGSPYPWHQDWSCCWRAHTDELITCFIYLDDATEVNGCLKVVPGSHKDKHIYPFKSGGHFEVDPASFDQDRIVPVPLNAGDMIYFDSYLLHYSDINRSQTPRRAMIYTYNPARLGNINEHRFANKG